MIMPAGHSMDSDLQPVDLAIFYVVLIRKPIICVSRHGDAPYSGGCSRFVLDFESVIRVLRCSSIFSNKFASVH
jgi:hypothetical protein